MPPPNPQVPLIPPVLLLIFNRPSETEVVLGAIKEAGPQRLYIAADGPRPDRPDDPERCEAARVAATQVDWECEVLTLFRETNLGCREAVRSGIDWFFEHEQEGIILEDDCLPHPSFFSYAGSMLERYRGHTRVSTVSGDGVLGAGDSVDTDYSFSRYQLIWGWATWRESWAIYDDSMADWPRLSRTSWLKDAVDGNPDVERYWRTAFDAAYTRRLDSWATAWNFACFREDRWALLPHFNLVSNIGFGPAATHTLTAGGWRDRAPTYPAPVNLRHPERVERNLAGDTWLAAQIFSIPPLRRRAVRGLQNRVRRAFGM